MDSPPPAITISAPPARMRSEASAIACKPELQNRLMVMAGTESGSPARRVACRAIFPPASPSGMAQPRMTSSTSSFAAGYRSSSARITVAARSSGRAWRSAPRGALPTAVRRQSIITASLIGTPIRCLNASSTQRRRERRGSAEKTKPSHSPYGFLHTPADRTLPLSDAFSALPLRSLRLCVELASSIPQCLPILQHVLHALLRLHIPAQTQKRFALQIQQILLRDLLRAGQASAAQHVCQLLPHHAIVLREVPALGRERHCHLERGVTRLAFHRDILPRHPRRPGRHTAERRRLGVRRQPFPVHGQAIAGPQEAQLARVRRARAHLAGPDQVERAFGV